MSSKPVSPVIHEAKFAKMSVSADAGTTWIVIPGVATVATSPGSTPTEETSAFEGTAQRAGSPPIGTMDVGIPAAAWSLGVMKTMWEARQSGALLKFKFETEAKTIFTAAGDGNTVAIAANTGVVTLAGDGKPDFTQRGDYAIGMVVQVGDKGYAITSINYETPVVKADVPENAAVVATKDYKIIVAGLRLGPFNGTITDGLGFSSGVDEPIGSEMTVSPSGQLPYFVMVLAA